MRKYFIFCILLGHILALYSQSWENFDNTSGLPDGLVQAVVIDASGHKWFGTTQGLVRYTGSEWNVYQSTEDKQTIASNDVRDIAFEQADTGPELWLATSDGVSVVGIQIDGITRATPYRSDNTGLINNDVHAVGVDKDHQRWFGTVGGVSMFNGGEWFSWSGREYLKNDDVRAIGVDPTSGWHYFCTNGGGVARLNVQLDGVTSASAYDYAWSGIFSDTTTAIAVEEDGDQWIGTIEGPAFHDTTETKVQWEVWNVDSGLVDNHIQAIALDQRGNAWYGTPKGLSLWNGRNFINYSAADGLINEDVRDIAVDSDGSLWIATAGGVSHFTPSSEVGETPVSLPDQFDLFPNFPNPFNPQTTLGFELGDEAQVTIEVFNQLGQRVRMLVQKTYAAGTHFLPWDGRNDHGLTARSGVYVVQIRVAGTGWNRVESQKIVMVK